MVCTCSLKKRQTEVVQDVGSHVGAHGYLVSLMLARLLNDTVNDFPPGMDHHPQLLLTELH